MGGGLHLESMKVSIPRTFFFQRPQTNHDLLARREESGNAAPLLNAESHVSETEGSCVRAPFDTPPTWNGSSNSSANDRWVSTAGLEQTSEREKNTPRCHTVSDPFVFRLGGAGGGKRYGGCTYEHTFLPCPLSRIMKELASS